METVVELWIKVNTKRAVGKPYAQVRPAGLLVVPVMIPA